MSDLVERDEVADLAANGRHTNLESPLTAAVAVPHTDHDRAPTPFDTCDPVCVAEIVDVAIEGPRLHPTSVETTLEVVRSSRSSDRQGSDFGSERRSPATACRAEGEPVVTRVIRRPPRPRSVGSLAVQADYFGSEVAAGYDDDGPMFSAGVVGPTVDFLATLAGADAALELGIGTGRIAVPLARRGVRVHGVDLSEAMVARLRVKPGAEGIRTTIGDFATVHVEGTFRLAYLVFNTIMNLTTQDAQVACFGNVARHLEPGGAFVVEVMVPDLRRLPPGERYVPFTVSDEHVGIDEYDVANQGLISHHHTTELSSIPLRYVWPAELDLMARLAGLSLRERWADWERAPFTSESRTHVSVWERAG